MLDQGAEALCRRLIDQVTPAWSAAWGKSSERKGSLRFELLSPDSAVEDLTPPISPLSLVGLLIPFEERELNNFSEAYGHLLRPIEKRTGPLWDL